VSLLLLLLLLDTSTIRGGCIRRGSLWNVSRAQD